MKIFSKIQTFIGLILTPPIFLLSMLMPRQKYTWVFIGWHRIDNSEIFADNTKYFFLYTTQHVKNLECIWLAKDRQMAQTLSDHGYQSYYQYSLIGIWKTLRAGFIVIDAYIQRENFRLTGRAKIIQLLHGKGMKAKGYSEPPLKKNDYIFSTSDFTLSILPEAFKTNSKNFITGYSRNDIFFESIKDTNISVSPKLIAKLHNIKNKNGSFCALYSPTFRRGQTNVDLQKIIAPDLILPSLIENDIYLFVSLHPKYRDQTRHLDYSNIIFIDESDIYPLLDQFDSLISDYSSIFTDFLLLDKPLIFYPYDLDHYGQTEGIAIDYSTMTPGTKVYTPQELLQEIISIKQGVDLYKEDRQKICTLYHQHKNGGASKRILEIINIEEKLKLDIN